MTPSEALARYIRRYCRENQIPYSPSADTAVAGADGAESGDAPHMHIMPIRVSDLLYSFHVGIAEDEIQLLSIRVPIMEVPVGKLLLPLYRKLLEINYALEGIGFSVHRTTVFLGSCQTVGDRHGARMLRYVQFKDAMRRISAVLTTYSESLFEEFGTSTSS